jgi:zinc protease
VYNISAVPLRRAGIADSCLLILHDWSHYLLLEDKEIDKERGVIHEEWRTRRAGMAVQRLMEQALPKIYKGTKYEDCLPIGSMDIVDHFPYQDLRDYYQKWYRPDLQAIVVVGDFDVDQMEKKIKKVFSSIPLPKKRAERIYYPVSDNDSMIVEIQKDAEQPIVLFHLYQKRDATPDAEKNQVKYMREGYVDALIGTMLNDRLSEMRQQANPPFQSATARATSFFVSRTKDAFSLSVSCKQNNILGGVIAAVGVTERARQHGFTKSELERAKSVYLNAAERRSNQKNDYRNSHYVNNCINHFLENEPLMSVDQKLEFTRQFDREVTLAEVNNAAKALITDQNQVVVVYAPDKETVKLPSEQQIEDVVLAAQRLDYAPYPEQQLAKSLMSSLPQPGSIVSEKTFGNNGFTEWTLSNGMKVYVRKTDYSADAITFRMKADGGTSVYPDADIPNFSLISSAVTEGGVGQFNQTTLRRMLNGKSVRLSPSVGSRGQSIGGSSSVKDMETLFQLAHLYFTQPRRDDAAFQGLMDRTRAFLTNRNASPKVDYNDSITAILYGHHPRMEPVVQKTLDKVSYDRILQIYKERFSDAANFKTVIIGNYDEKQLRQLVCQYLATLPATGKHEQANEQHVPQIVEGNFTRTFKKKMATPLANVSIYYTADVPFSAKADLELDFLNRVLQIAYTDSVREEKGGTYGVRVAVNFDKDDHPTAMMRISYNADPTRYEELNPIVYQQLQNIADNGPLASSMDKVRKYLLKQYDQMAITNDYWNYVIWHELEDGVDFDKDYKKMVSEVTAQQVQHMARQLLASKRRIEVTMLSE